MNQRHQVDLAPQQQGTDAERAAHLVPGDGHRVDAGRGEVERHLAKRLDGVGVDRDAVRARQRDDFGDRLKRPDFVVGPHDADEGHTGGVPLDQVAHRPEV